MASRTNPIRDPQMEANEDRRRAVVARTYGKRPAPWGQAGAVYRRASGILRQG